MPTTDKNEATTPVANDPKDPVASDSKDPVVGALALEVGSTLGIGAGNKPEGVDSTTLDIFKLAGKMPYAMFPDIVEDMMAYASVSTLLEFRATCKKLRDRADRIFGAHLEVYMSGISLIIETPGRRVIKGQRIPAMMDRGPFEIGVDFEKCMPPFQPEPEDIWFKVPRKDAEWFKTFLKGVKVVDFHGPTALFTLQTINRNNPDAMDPFGQVSVDAIKVPIVRYFPTGDPNDPTIR